MLSQSSLPILRVSVYSTFYKNLSPPAASLICRETRLTNMGVLTSYQVYLRAQDTRPHNHLDQPGEQTSLFTHLFIIVAFLCTCFYICFQMCKHWTHSLSVQERFTSLLISFFLLCAEWAGKGLVVKGNRNITFSFAVLGLIFTLCSFSLTDGNPTGLVFIPHNITKNLAPSNLAF